MSLPKAIFFDVDGTIAESFQPAKPEMLERIARLLSYRPVALITGANFERIEKDVLVEMPLIKGLYLFPNSSTQAYVFEGNAWRLVYNMQLTDRERERIRHAIESCVEEMPLLREAPSVGERILDRGTQIAFAITGWDAPFEVKKSWDPTGAKRREICAALTEKIPDFDILLGGMVTIDITHKGVNKTHGVRWLSERLNIPINEMLYVGDALFPGGNDFVVIETGIQTRATSGPDETLGIIGELLAACAVEGKGQPNVKV